MFHHRVLALAAGLLAVPVVFAFSWNATEYMFVFGDSYTADGYNVSVGIDSPDPGRTSANGPNWVEYLANTYNQTAIKTFNLASGGATIDGALVPSYYPGVLSVVEQVSEFDAYLASKPAGAPWCSANSLFAFWIGINDVGLSAGWTNVTRSQFYGVLADRLFSQVDALYDAGARHFLFLTVPPTNRTPLLLEQGPEAASQMGADVAEYNGQLTRRARDYYTSHADVSIVLFDTQPVFNVLLDRWQTFGFVNVTGYCAAYENGTPTRTYQVEGCAPVSSYLWLNSLHPVFTVHGILAKAISTALAGYPVMT